MNKYFMKYYLYYRKIQYYFSAPMRDNLKHNIGLFNEFNINLFNILKHNYYINMLGINHPFIDLYKHKIGTHDNIMIDGNPDGNFYRKITIEINSKQSRFDTYDELIEYIKQNKIDV